MKRGPLQRATSAVALSVATLAGVAFFFFIIGVFGLPAAMTALALFIGLSLLIFRRPPIGEAKS